MGSDDEVSEDTEEIFVYVEFEGFVDGNAFNEAQLQLDMIGIDTEHPIMQINGRFYEGTYEDAVGTYMFFAKNDKPFVDDPVFDTVPTLKYFAKTRKVLKMQRIFIKQRTEVLGDSEHDHCIPNLNTIVEAGVPLKYQNEALSFWNTMRDDRMNALHSYLEKQRIREEKKSQGVVLDSESDDDNPFAIYKHGEEIEDVDNLKTAPTEAENDEAKSCVNIEEPVTAGTSTDENILMKDLESLAIAGTEKSISDDSTRIKCTQNRKTAIAGSRKKRTTVVHNVRRKKHRKEQIVKKPVDSSVTKEEEKFASTKDAEDPDKTVTDSSELTEIVQVQSNDPVETTRESTSEIGQSSSTTSKMTKQLKREAKMKEISDRLKIMSGQSNAGDKGEDPVSQFSREHRENTRNAANIS